MGPYNHFSQGSARGTHSGPSDDMLAIDAASEMRSFNIIYDRYADDLYRYFFAVTGDFQAANRYLTDLVEDLPRELQHFVAGEHSFAGWVFRLASSRAGQDRSLIGTVSQLFDRLTDGGHAVQERTDAEAGVGDVRQFAMALREMPFVDREVLALSAVIGLSNRMVSDALGLPMSLVTARLESSARELARLVEASRPSEVRERLAQAFSAVRVPPQQREAHQSIIRAAFGESDGEVRSSGLVREITLVAAIILLGAVGLWGWDYLADRASEEAQEETVASDSESSSFAPVDGPTATPNPSGPVASSAMNTCEVDERIALFQSFVDHYNQGNFDELAGLLPDASYEHEILTENQGNVGAGNGVFVITDQTFFDQNDVLTFLRERHAQGERWENVDAVPAEEYRDWYGPAPIDLYLEWDKEYPDLGLVIINGLTRTSEDSGDQKMRGRAVIDCNEGRVITWALYPDSGQQVGEPIDMLEFLHATTALNAGEERIWNVRVMTEQRADSGLPTQWDLEWREFVTSDGALKERITVTSFEGEELVSYVYDGERWRLEQRGWTRFGTDERVPFPEEISSVLPWLSRSAGLAHANRNNITWNANLTIDSGPIDVQRTAFLASDVYADPGVERRFELEIANGALVSGRLVERARDGSTTIRPLIDFLSVERSTDIDPEHYRIMYQPRYLDGEVNAPRYVVPESSVPQLAVEDVTFGGNRASENYQLRWNDVSLTLTVTPSRGGLNTQRLPEEFRDLWQTTMLTEYSHGTFAWTFRQGSDTPIDAIWDNGRFHFELHVDQDSLTDDLAWNLQELTALIEALAAVES